MLFELFPYTTHVTLIYRHALLALDGVESTNENPKVKTEHFFVISYDDKHDQHFTHFVQKEVSEYLKSISYNVNTMHDNMYQPLIKCAELCDFVRDR
jgi:hypothetical protein